MARRRVTVDLDLQARGYLGTARQVQVATKATEHAIDELGDQADNTGRDLAQVAANSDVAARRIDHLGGEAKRSSVGLKWLEQTVRAFEPLFPLATRRADRLAAAIDEVGDQARQSAAAVGALDRQVGRLGGFTGLQQEIARSRTEVHRLRAEIGRTGDQSLFGDLRREESSLRRMTRLMDMLVPDRVTSMPFPKLDFSRLVGESRGVLIAGLVAFVAAAAPAIGAAIAGAVTGAVGAGGVIGGVAAATTDQRVKDAWKSLGESINADDFVSDALLRPSIDAAHELRDAFHDLDIGKSLQLSAPWITTVAKGVGDLARNLMPGLNTALARSGPYMATLAKGFGEMGQSLGYMLAKMSESRGSVEGLQGLFNLINGTLVGTGNTVDWLADRWHGMLGVEAKVFGALEDLPPVLPQLLLVNDWAADYNDLIETYVARSEEAANATGDVGGKMSDFARYLAEAAEHAGDLHVRLSELFAAEMGVDQATLRWNEDLLRLRETFAKNGRTLAENTEAGLENRQMILSMIQDAIAMRDAVMEETGSQERANQVYQDKIALLEQLLRKMGLTKEQIDKLVGEYHIAFVVTTTGAIPKGVSFNQGSMGFAAGESATMTVPVIGRFPTVSSPTTPAAPTTTFPQRMARQRQFYQFAAGGETPAFAPWRVHKDETVWDSYSTYVATAAQSRAMGGLPPVNLTVQMVDTAGRVTRETLITDALARGVAHEVVQVAYP